MRPFSFAIIDDELPAIEVTRTLMHPWGDFQCVAAWQNPEDALKEFPQHLPDLLFLDVEMPAMTGLDFLHQLSQKTLSKQPITILVTAFSQYAVDAFSLGVREYVLKPMSAQRLELALNNIRPLLDAAEKSKQRTNTLAFKDGYEQRFVNPNHVIRIVAEGNFSTLVLTSGESCLISESLRELSGRLASFGFVRVHKSTLVNIACIKGIRSNVLTLSDGTTQTIGRTYQENVKGLF